MHLSINNVFYIFCCCLWLVGASCKHEYPKDHLVVLVHGLLGHEADLSYLDQKLVELGFVTLRSKRNWWIKSLAGVKRSAERLVAEIDEMLQYHEHDLKKISFVGNSLGGVIARYAIQIMHQNAISRQHVNGMQPHKKGEVFIEDEYLCASSTCTSTYLLPVTFLTIASPFLGVHDFSYIEDYLQRMSPFEVSIPSIAKKCIAASMWATGAELFMQDHYDMSERLLYKMTHSEEFLKPLRMFKRRRAYANLDNDFMVIPETGAFLGRDAVQRLRQEHLYSESMQMGRRGKPSIVANFTTAANELKYDSGTYESMRRNLDNLGWEKVIVYFPGTLPLAHNAIAGVCKKPDFLFMPFCKLMGFDAGYFVMDHAALFLASAGAGPSACASARSGDGSCAVDGRRPAGRGRGGD